MITALLIIDTVILIAICYKVYKPKHITLLKDDQLSLMANRSKNYGK